MPIRAFVFDAYGTLYDVQSVLERVERACPAAAYSSPRYGGSNSLNTPGCEPAWRHSRILVR